MNPNDKPTRRGFFGQLAAAFGAMATTPHLDFYRPRYWRGSILPKPLSRVCVDGAEKLGVATARGVPDWLSDAAWAAVDETPRPGQIPLPMATPVDPTATLIITVGVGSVEATTDA